MAYYGFTGTGDNDGGYNPRTHSKIAEKEGFHISGGGGDEPRTLYVGNLDPSVTDEFIGTLFGNIGSVTKTKIIFDGSSDPYAFVEFSDHQQAAQALQAMNGRVLLDKAMKVNWAVEPGATQAKIDTSRHFHVFVGDLSPEVDNKILREAFVPFGTVSDSKVIRDTLTLKSKGYGFVSYPTREEAERAIEQMNGQWLGRRTIRTNWATRKPGTEGSAPAQTHHEKSYDEVYNQTTADNTSVYVGNIAANATEDDIRKEFGHYGRIVEVRIFKLQGYAFVKFDSKEGAAKAIVNMNGQDVCGQAVRCSWGKTENVKPPGDGAGGRNHGGPNNGGGYGYAYGAGGAFSSGGSSNHRGHARGGGGAEGGDGNGGPNSQQYWQYYQQYYGNNQMAAQWQNYWNQQGGGPPGQGKQ